MSIILQTIIHVLITAATITIGFLIYEPVGDGIILVCLVIIIIINADLYRRGEITRLSKKEGAITNERRNG